MYLKSQVIVVKRSLTDRKCTMFSHKVLLFSGFIISVYANLLFDYGILRGNDVIGEATFSVCSDNIALDTSITFLNEEYDNLLVSITFKLMILLIIIF